MTRPVGVSEAAASGDLEALRAALAAGGSPRELLIKHRRNVPAIERAAKHDHFAAVDVLLTAGAFTEDDWTSTARDGSLAVLLRTGHPEILNVLADHAQSRFGGSRGRAFAFLLRRMIALGLPLGVLLEDWLQGSLSVVEDTLAEDGPPLRTLAEEVGATKWLRRLTPTADKSAKGGDAAGLKLARRRFDLAARQGDVGGLREAIAAGVDVNFPYPPDGETALMRSTMGNFPVAVEYLLSVGAEVDARSRSGDTALCYASWKSSLDAARVLLATGADPNARTVQGSTPLHLAGMYGGTAEVAALLLEHGALLEAESLDGDFVTPLQAACRGNNLPVVRVLLDAGAAVNAVQPSGGRSRVPFSALSCTLAMRYAGGSNPKTQREILLLLLERGADWGRAGIDPEQIANRTPPQELSKAIRAWLDKARQP